MTFSIVLYEPEIPQNTGNIIRLCANTGAELHLIEPFGFEWNDKRLKRAGLDYHEYANVRRYSDYAEYLEANGDRRLYSFSTKATHRYTEVEYDASDAFMFGPETRGLPESIRAGFDPQKLLKIPMQPESRSLNLANSVAVVLYEAWRQLDFIVD